MKRLTLLAGVVLAALPAVASAQDTARLVGTWECRVPGAEPTRTPPIVWFGGAYSEGKIVPSAIDLDGFARAVSGLSNVAAAGRAVHGEAARPRRRPRPGDDAPARQRVLPLPASPARRLSPARAARAHPPRRVA